MSKKCPPGVICVENFTFLYVFISIVIVLYLFFYLRSSTSPSSSSPSINIENNISPQSFSRKEENRGYRGWGNGFFGFSWPYTNLDFGPRDTLLDPYAPPLRDERYITDAPLEFGNGAIRFGGRGNGYSGGGWREGYDGGGGEGRIPINIQTNPNVVDTNFRQVGILTPPNSNIDINKGNSIMPLMGRPIDNRRDSWQYYTISNQHNNVKLPVKFKGRNGMTDNGVDKIYSKDTVFVEGNNDTYKATIYENDTIRYLPFV